MWARRTCGEPTELELTAIGVKLNCSRRVHASATYFVGHRESIEVRVAPALRSQQDTITATTATAATTAAAAATTTTTTTTIAAVLGLLSPAPRHAWCGRGLAAA